MADSISSIDYNSMYALDGFQTIYMPKSLDSVDGISSSEQQSGRPARPDRPDISTGTNRSDRPERPDRPEKPDKSDVYAEINEAGYSDKLDFNTDGAVTNAELSQYQNKIEQDFGSNLVNMQDKSVGNVATYAQAINVYAANEAAYVAPYTSSIQMRA